MSNVLSPAAPAPRMLDGPSLPSSERPWSDATWVVASVVALVAAVVTAAAFPGQISWINDEPRLLAKAWHANRNHELAVYGLMGNFQVTYGPVATQIYQAMLLFTHDPVAIAPVRAALCGGVTTLGFVWLARTLRMNPWMPAALAMGPHLWDFHRILWDASFAIPVGAVALAAYAAFLRRGRPLPLALAVFCGLLLPFIHPMSLVLGLPVAVHMVWRNHAALRRHWLAVAVAAALVLGLNARYLLHLLLEITMGSFGSQYGMASEHGRLAAALAPFLSGRILSGDGFAPGCFHWDGVGIPVLLAKSVAYVVYPLVWIGFAAALWRIIPRRRAAAVAEPITPAADNGHDLPAVAPVARRRRGEFNRVSADAARDALGGIAVAASLIQLVLFGLKRVPPETQYYFGSFAVHAFLAWVAVDVLMRYRLTVARDDRGPADGEPARRSRRGVRVGNLLVAAYGLSVATMTLGSIYAFRYVLLPDDSEYAHRPEYPWLSEQAKGARLLNPYSNQSVYTDVTFFQRNPQALRSLRLLLQPEPGTPRREAPALLLRWGDSPHGKETVLEVVEIAPPARPEDLGSGVKELDVTPLPDGWLPP